jgi:hypothetical protein
MHVRAIVQAFPKPIYIYKKRNARTIARTCVSGPGGAIKGSKRASGDHRLSKRVPGGLGCLVRV